MLCDLTGNVTLVRAWETLTGPIRVAILFAGPAAALANMSAARHQQLLDAIATGDPDAARSAVDTHMREAARTTAGLHGAVRYPSVPGGWLTHSVNSQQLAFNRL